MASVIVRNLSAETYRALYCRAAVAGRSIQAEILTILENAVRPEGRVKLGTLLAEVGGVDLRIECDRTWIQPDRFE